MDSILRKNKRQAAIGDVDAEIQWLRERARLGSTLTWECKRCIGDGREPYPTPDDDVAYLVGSVCISCHGTKRITFEWEDRLKLAAYCGHPAARILVPCDCCSPAWAFCNLTFRLWLKNLGQWPGALDKAALAAAKEILSEDDNYCCNNRLKGCQCSKKFEDKRPRLALEAMERGDQEAWYHATPVMDTLLWVPRPGQNRIFEIEFANHFLSVREPIEKALIKWTIYD